MIKIFKKIEHMRKMREEAGGRVEANSSKATTTKDTASTDPVDWVELYADYLYRFALVRIGKDNRSVAHIEVLWVAG